MPLPDIKDAGILDGFTRWGWPFHGIIAGGTIGATGQAHPQPLDGNSYGNNMGWLIDYGMPAVTLTPDEATYFAGLNMEWRNYALIAGGYAYGTYIGAETYIHIAEDGTAWRVALAYSYPVANTLRITATIERFGYLRIDGEYTAPAPAVVTADVACASIELVSPYSYRYSSLQDVFTNGSKALIGVLLRQGGGDDLFSLVELTITGAGGENGAALTLSAAEVKAAAALTPGALIETPLGPPLTWFTKDLAYINDSQTQCGPDEALFTITAVMVDRDYGSEVNYDQKWTYIYARYGYYNAAGNVVAVRFKDYESTEDTRALLVDLHISGGTTTGSCTCVYKSNPPACPNHPSAETSGTIRQTNSHKRGYYLMENDSVIDEISWLYVVTTDTVYTTGSASSSTTSGTLTKQGALSAYIADSTPANPFPGSINSGAMMNAFRSPFQQDFSSAQVFNGSTKAIGLHKMSSKAVAFVGSDGPLSDYGIVSSPLGPLATALTPAASINFAFNRKTGEYTFANEPICYV